MGPGEKAFPFWLQSNRGPTTKQEESTPLNSPDILDVVGPYGCPYKGTATAKGADLSEALWRCFLEDPSGLEV